MSDILLARLRGTPLSDILLTHNDSASSNVIFERVVRRLDEHQGSNKRHAIEFLSCVKPTEPSSRIAFRRLARRRAAPAMYKAWARAGISCFVGEGARLSSITITIPTPAAWAQRAHRRFLPCHGHGKTTSPGIASGGRQCLSRHSRFATNYLHCCPSVASVAVWHSHSN